MYRVRLASSSTVWLLLTQAGLTPHWFVQLETYFSTIFGGISPVFALCYQHLCSFLCRLWDWMFLLGPHPASLCFSRPSCMSALLQGRFCLQMFPSRCWAAPLQSNTMRPYLALHISNKLFSCNVAGLTEGFREDSFFLHDLSAWNSLSQWD